jgi:hypothetical protein
VLEKLTIVTPKELIGTESYKKTLTFPRDRPTRTAGTGKLWCTAVQLYVCTNAACARFRSNSRVLRRQSGHFSQISSSDQQLRSAATTASRHALLQLYMIKYC